MKRRLPVKISMMGLASIVLLVASDDSFALTEMLNPTVKMNAVSVDGIFDLDDNPIFGLITQQILSSDPNVPTIDKRGALEFPLISVPSGSTITAATLELNVSSTESGVIPVTGYAGDGVADVGDVAVTGNQLGASGLITQAGIHLINLEADFITGLIGTSTHLGLLLMGDAGGAEVAFGSLGIEPAVLSITFGTPGDFDLDGDVDGEDFLFWQQGGSPDPLSAEDLLDWESNYGMTSSVVAIAGVPEPGSLGLALTVCMGMLMRRTPASSRLAASGPAPGPPASSLQPSA